MNMVESQIFAWVLHFRQLSYKLDYRENQTGVQRLKNIQEDIKTGKFKQAYLLYGEEAYLKQQYKRNLVKALNPDDDTMNFTRYEGKGIDVRELLSLCDTMPFFAERRVVLLEDTGFFKNKCEELADYMKALPDYLYLVFCESEVDKRSRMYKAVKACGSIGEFKQQDEKTLMRWAAGILGKNGRRITQRDVELLLTMTGTDMGNIRMELEKLISYTVGRDVVTAADIQAVCTTQTTNKIFDMVRAVTEKNQKRALDLYYDLLTLREPPMRILFLLAKQFRQICLTKKMSGGSFSNRDRFQTGSTLFCCAESGILCQILHCGRAGECCAGFCGCGRGGKDRYTWRCAQRGASDREVQLGENSESLSFTEKGSATGSLRCP